MLRTNSIAVLRTLHPPPNSYNYQSKIIFNYLTPPPLSPEKNQKIKLSSQANAKNTKLFNYILCRGVGEAISCRARSDSKLTTNPQLKKQPGRQKNPQKLAINFIEN